MDNSIGVIGGGFVGTAVAEGFKGFRPVKVYDVDESRRTHSLEETLDSEFVFVCLPTPMVAAEGGECNLSILEGFFDQAIPLVAARQQPRSWTTFIIKSTVPVGTTARLHKKYKDQGLSGFHLVHSPEFLTARAANADFVNPARNVVGGADRGVVLAAGLLSARFPGVPCFIMDSNESEFVKYTANCFLAAKVSFFNEMYLFAEKKGLDWQKVMQGVLSDPRIGNSHTQVPGPDGDRGYGGTCFPKDTNALIAQFVAEGLDPKMLKASWDQNKAVRQDWDWAKSKSAVQPPQFFSPVCGRPQQWQIHSLTEAVDPNCQEKE